MTKQDTQKKAKIFVSIPIIITSVVVISIIMANILEKPCNRGGIYLLFAAIGLFGIMLAPFPCFVSSILGTVFAISGKHKAISIIGIIEILVSIFLIYLSVIFFINAQSV